MSNLFAALGISANALRALQSALEITQNNVSNASTPGFAKQRATLLSLPFDPSTGLPGGVRTGAPQDSRSGFAESAVWKQVQSQGYQNQLTASLAAIASQFEVSGEAGISGALNRFYQAASAWSVAPNSATARQQVLSAAEQLAAGFRSAAGSLSAASSQAEGELRSTVDQINSLGVRLAGLNRQRMQSGAQDAGLDANIHATLEELAALTDFTTLRAGDGSLSVLLGGQTPLVLSDQAFPIQATTSSQDPSLLSLTDSGGRDITAQISQGRLGGLLSVRNRVLPTLLGDGQQAGDLNRLAAAVADRVNAILVQGQVPGPTPQNGTPLFAYTAGSPAATLALAPGVTPGGLSSLDPGPPPVSNGVPLALAGLATSSDPADQLDGVSFVAFYGAVGGRVGQLQASARDAATRQAAQVAQAHSMRDQLSGVSLDEEATLILQYQKGYQAAAQMVRVIDEMAQSVLDMLR